MKTSNFGFLVLFLAGLSAQADRTVSFIPNQGLSITNPSSQTMTFDIQCKGETGAVILSATNASLAPGNSWYVAEEGCKEKTEQSWGNGDMYRCSTYANTSGSPGMGPYIKFSEAAPLCGSGYHVCQIDSAADVSTLKTYIVGMQSYSAWLSSTQSQFRVGWIDTMATPNVFIEDTMGASPRTTVPTGSPSSTLYYQPRIDSMGGSSACTKDVASPTLADAVPSCFGMSVYDPMMMTYGTASSVMCCPNAGAPRFTAHAAAGYCSVTVHGDSGHLITPAFKGGTPF